MTTITERKIRESNRLSNELSKRHPTSKWKSADDALAFLDAQKKRLSARDYTLSVVSDVESETKGVAIKGYIDRLRVSADSTYAFERELTRIDALHHLRQSELDALKHGGAKIKDCVEYQSLLKQLEESSRLIAQHHADKMEAHFASFDTLDPENDEAAAQ